MNIFTGILLLVLTYNTKKKNMHLNLITESKKVNKTNTHKNVNNFLV